MTTITLDPQPDSPKCFSTDALTAPRSVAPPQSPLNKTRLVCEWKRTADGPGALKCRRPVLEPVKAWPGSASRGWAKLSGRAAVL